MTRVMISIPLMLLLLGFSRSCGRKTTAAEVSGIWGGMHIGLVVADTGATAEYDCAHGRITETIRPNSNGRFDARGVHFREHGGPVREGEIENPLPAIYTGHIGGDRMTLTVTLESGEKIGTFDLTRGGSPNVFKCL